MHTENIEQDNVYKTTDVYIAASLLAYGCMMVDMTKKEKQFTFYITSDTDDVSNLVNRFWAGKMLVDAKKLFGGFRELRARMYN